MQLIGAMLSPYVRRVAVTLLHHGMTFEQKPLKVVPDREEVERLNPLGRVPILILADGEVLVDSHAILDHIDRSVGPDHVLVPLEGRPRRDALQALALGHGTLEKAVLSYYERTRRPEAYRWPEGIARYDEQTAAGLAVYDAMAQTAADTGQSWLTPAGRLMQVDIMAVVLWDFVGVVNPALRDGLDLPALKAFAETKGQTEPFAGTAPG